MEVLDADNWPSPAETYVRIWMRVRVRVWIRGRARARPKVRARLG